MATRILIGILLAIFISTLLALRGGAANPAFIPQTQPADGITATQAVLRGTIGLNGKAGYVAFQVRKAGKKRYVGHTPWQKIARGQTNVSFSAMVSGLLQETDYEFRAVALVGAVKRVGNQLTFRASFTTPAAPPTAITLPAGDVTGISATLNASVNANSSPTSVSFQWGPTTNYGNVTPPKNIASASNAVVVQSSLSGLVPGTTYHFRVIATNLSGVSTGSDLTFATPCFGGTNVAVVTNCTEADLLTAVASASSVRLACDGTITLTRPIDVDCSLTLDASGRSVTLSGGNSNRLFNVAPGANLQLFNLTVADGHAQGTNAPLFEGGSAEGGALRVMQGTLVAADCRFERNTVMGGAAGTIFPRQGGGAFGAAIRADSSMLLLTNCSFLGNRATGGPGSPGGPGQGQGLTGDSSGGALSAATSSVQIVNCFFRTNNAGAGAAIQVTGGTLQIRQSSLVQNGGSSDGGGILNNGASVVVSACEFTGNSVVSAPSGLPISGWPLGVHTCGGAICQSSGSIEVSDCQFTSNVSFGAPSGHGSSASRPVQGYNGQGGAVGIKGGTAWIQRSAFVANSAVGGGASGYVGSPFYYADSGEGIGGAVFSQGMVSLTNCTFASNAASSGPIPFDNFSYPRPDPNAGKGGALANLGGTLQIFFSTIASNTAYNGANHHPTNAAYGGGIFNGSGSTLLIANSIVAWNNVNATNVGNAFGVVADGGHNISSDATANFSAPGSLNLTDPLLGPLGDYGGFTLTFPLLPGSPAIDAADPTSSPATDQRGVARPQGPAPDIGAFERQ